MNFNLYCIKECPIGKEKSNKLINDCESIWDASSDMEKFISECQCKCKRKKWDYNKDNP